MQKTIPFICFSIPMLQPSCHSRAADIEVIVEPVGGYSSTMKQATCALDLRTSAGSGRHLVVSYILFNEVA